MKTVDGQEKKRCGDGAKRRVRGHASRSRKRPVSAAGSSSPRAARAAFSAAFCSREAAEGYCFLRSSRHLAHAACQGKNHENFETRKIVEIKIIIVTCQLCQAWFRPELGSHEEGSFQTTRERSSNTPPLFLYAPLGTCYMECISCCIVSQALLDYSP